jgi:predicted O-methyltransferase YrrM
MTQKLWSNVEKYFAGMIGEDAALKAAVKDCKKAKLPPIGVAPNEGKFLQLIAKMINAKKILEIGTLGGYSTIWLARGLGEGGRLITLEYERKHADVAQKNIARAGLENVVEIRVGDAKATMPQLVGEGAGPFDLIFLDADKEGYTAYFEWSLKLSRKGTVIIADNVVREGEILRAKSKDAGVPGIQKFNKAVTKEKRVSATPIQTVGSKGYDGFAVIIVK